jgi:gliding motility-associated-like protein
MFFLRTSALFIGLIFNTAIQSQVIPESQQPLSEIPHRKITPANNSPFRILKLDSRANEMQRTQKTFSSALDTCATFTYRLKIGTDNTNEEATEITTLGSGEMLVTGKTNKNNAQDDALLVKINAGGNVEWIKTFGENNEQEIFYKAHETDDGGIIAIGTSYNASSLTSFILVCKIDVDGNLQWTRRFRSATDVADRGADIIQLISGDFAFLGDNGKAVLYGKLSNTGNLLWDQKLNASDSTRALNIVEDYNGWIIACAGMDTGWHVSNVMKVDSSNGNFIWRRRFGGSNMNAHYIFQKMEFINLRPRITGIFANDGGPYRFMRVNVNTTSAIESIEEFTTVGAIDTTANIVLTPWAEALAFSPNNKTASISIFKDYPDVESINWAYSYAAGANLYVKAIERTQTGGFVTAANITNSLANDILLIQIDSAGLSPGCEGSAFTISENVTQPSIPSIGAINSNGAFTVNSNQVPAANIILDTVYTCHQLTCPVRPIEDTCLQTFYKNYRSYEFCDVATSVAITDDDHIILAGVNRDNPYDASWQRAYIFKTDNKGNLEIKKKFTIGQNCLIQKQFRSNDNDILAAGSFIQSETLYGFFIIKLDKNLNIIWSKTYSVTQSPWQFLDITEAADGSIFCGLYYYNFPLLDDRMVLIKFDNAGNFLWQKMYRPSGSISQFANYGKLIATGSDIYFVSQVFFEADQRFKTLVTSIDQGSGSLLWSKRYSSPGSHTNFLQSFKMLNNSFFFEGFFDLPTVTYEALMTIDASGNILKLKTQKSAYPSAYMTSTLASNSDILISDKWIDYPAAKSYSTFLRLDSNLNIRYSKKTSSPPASYPIAMKEDPQGYVFVSGYNGFDNVYNADLFLRKYTFDGLLGTCPSDSLIFDDAPVSFSVSDQGMNTISGAAISPSSVGVTELVYSIQQNSFNCGSVSGCDTVWLMGLSSICDSTEICTFNVHKNATCTAPINWIFDPTGVQVLEKNDSLLNVRFLKNEIFKVKAQLLTGCRILEDSFETQIKISPKQLYLGADTILCPSNKLLLHAGPGFSSYIWNDGSVDSTFLITTPGKYFVHSTNDCGVVFNDTILVVAAPPIPFNAGPDLSKCNKDSVTITAPSGFLNYTWAPSYNITSTTTQTVTLFPYADTLYYLSAEKTPGCFSYDSIRIYVKQSPLIDLGLDKSICHGDSLMLDAGSGFNFYRWSSGELTSKIFVHNTGIYFITATDPQNCRSADTVTITVYNNPIVNLSKDSAICAGSPLQLNAGPGYSGYLWNDGSTSQSMFAGNVGKYWVRVTDSHNCTGSDTAQITLITLPPSKFLTGDTSMCQYSSIQLRPIDSYKNYLWSNGSVSNNISVSSAGLYWLQVTDSSNCIGRDTVVVAPKECMEGCYVPSAFTPNRDGKNDIFRPLIFGKVVKYRFIIYNRWGEKVFETTELGKGWDGKINGVLQSSFVFVWQCLYQFEGGEPSFQKGTATLIR